MASVARVFSWFAAHFVAIYFLYRVQTRVWLSDFVSFPCRCQIKTVIPASLYPLAARAHAHALWSVCSLVHEQQVI